MSVGHAGQNGRHNGLGAGSQHQFLALEAAGPYCTLNATVVATVTAPLFALAPPMAVIRT
jgi:hypothetical protein